MEEAIRLDQATFEQASTSAANGFPKVTDQMSVAGSKPEVGNLIAELRRAATDYGIGSRIQRVENTRYCRWAGQSEDGKKWNANGPNKQAFPWDGASDTRIPLADEVINNLVDLQTTAFWRSMIHVSPVNTDKMEASATMHSLMDFVTSQQLYTSLIREVELASQYVNTYGWSGVHITWQQEINQKETRVTIEQINQMAMQSQAGTITADLPMLIQNPEAEDQVAELLCGAFPNLKKGRARQAVRDLRNDGECEFPVPYVSRNSPQISALCPWDELTFPAETTDLQSARVVFRRIYMTEIEVRQKILTDEWDPEWAQEAINTMGKFSNYSDYTYTIGLTNNALTSREHLIEICYAYQKAINDDGVPGVWVTVFSPQVGDKWGKYELLEYGHGQYPFVVWRSELIHRKITESRGVPDICSTWQNEVKAQRDSIQDYTSISTIPPLLVPKTRGGNLRIGPAVQVPVLRPNEISWMPTPEREPTVAFTLIGLIEAQTDRYFGRPTEKVPPQLTQARQQRIINNWLHGWTDVFRQVMALTLQYMGPEEISRITLGQVVPTEEDLQFDVCLKFDVRELSTDLVTEKLKAISTLVLPLDSAGVVDRAKLIGMLLRAIDPTMAKELVMQSGPAAQKMFDETNSDIALMSLGNPPKLRENDPTAQTRLQFTQQIMGANPKYVQQVQQDPVFQENMKKYIENLQFSVQQQQNAVTGRLGVAPS